MRHHRRRPRFDILEDRRLLAVVTVNSNLDVPPPTTVLTLREAIEIVDGTLPISSLSPQQKALVNGPLSNPNTIAFNIASSGVQTIKPTSELPEITTPVIINGYTEPGSRQNTLAVGDNAKIMLELDGELAGPQSNGLFLGGGHSIVEGLVVNRFGTGTRTLGQPGGVGLYFANNVGGNLAWGNFVGTDPTGTIAEPNATYGVIFTSDTSPDSLGGTQPGARNVIEMGSTGSLNQFSVDIDHENNPYILGNYLGTNASGTGLPIGVSAPEARAISLINVSGAQIGGPVAGQGNVIEGIWIGSDASVTTKGYNTIRGNVIGTDVTGKHAFVFGNYYAGIAINNSIGNVIGGATPGTGNVIAAENQTAVYLGADNSNNVLGTVVEGNHIGTDLTGTVNFGDTWGVALSSSGNAIGDLAPGTGNVIAFSTENGVVINNAQSNGNIILANSFYGNSSKAIAPATATGVTTASITSAYPVATGLLIHGGTFAGGAPKTPYVVEFFSSPGFDTDGLAEGRQFLGRITVVTDATGMGSFRTLLPVGVQSGKVLTATVTGAAGNTTAFSKGVVVSPQPFDALTLAALPGSSHFGQPVSLLAVVVPSVASIGVATGSVVFMDGSTALAVVPLDSMGKAIFTTSALARGSHRIYAVYTGDPVYTGALANPVSVTVG
jgi:hypothetical protein